ncbi:MAG: hypothetical protein A3G13_01840 [Candidatus Levybacteria bacterium RIFCSPLOWO2_12_FULL_37_7]|nr:MAG: hypothetical protein A3G13_01840 [Candidatus Levybacteria bacterium RIFCSPLOWO2_12_FULL_37_7]
MKRILYVIVLIFIYISIYPFTKNQSLHVEKRIKGTKIIATPVPGSTSNITLYQVVHVVDGDTIQVDINGSKETIRLIGVDTPEVVDPRKPVQCFGREASNKTKEILIGKKVRLESDPTQSNRDKYQRLLRYVFLEDGTLFNKLLIEQGYAHEYTYQSNSYRYQLEFKTAEKDARENKRGLWAEDICLK